MTAQGFPQINAPIAGQGGKITQPWYQLIISLWNCTGGTTGTASPILDQITSSVGSILYRGSSSWVGLAPPSSTPKVLTYQGGTTPLLWGNAGTGTITGVTAGTALSGGGTSGSVTLNLSANGVTNSLLAQMAAKTIKGNNTVATANASDLTVAQIQQMSGQAQISTVTNSVNFNSANSDTSISISLPTGFTRYLVSAVLISGANSSLTTATCGLFTGSGGTGTAIVTGASAITVSSASEGTNNNSQSLTINDADTQSYTNATLYFRVGTAEGSAATASVTITILPVS